MNKLIWIVDRCGPDGHERKTTNQNVGQGGAITLLFGVDADRLENEYEPPMMDSWSISIYTYDDDVYVVRRGE